MLAIAGCHDTQLAMLLRYLALTYEALERNFPDDSQAHTFLRPWMASLDVDTNRRAPPPTAPEFCHLEVGHAQPPLMLSL